MPWPKFPDIKSSLVLDVNLAFSMIENDPLLKKSYMNHPFNQMLQIAVPYDSESKSVQLNTHSFIDRFPYLLVESCPLFLLVHPVLVKSFVLNGDLFVTSNGTNVAMEDCVSLSSKLLTLSVTDLTYRRLGLIGRKSILVRQKKIIQKYIIEINLEDKLATTISSKYFQRLFCLMRNSNLKFDLLFKWKPVDAQYSSLSLVKFFEWAKNSPQVYFLDKNDSINLKVNICKSNCVTRIRRNVFCPIHLTNNGEEDDGDVNLIGDIRTKLDNDSDRLKYTSSIDWIGAQFSNVEMNESLIDNDVTSFFLPEDDLSLVKSLELHQLTGFFTPDEVMTIMKELNQLCSSSPYIPFTALVILGFENCCISWEGKRNEHSSKLSGENLIGLVLKKSHLESGIEKKNNFLWRLADEYDFGIERL